MAITAERMQRLISAASIINESLQGLDRTMAEWDIAIANGELTYEQAYRNVRPWLYRMGPRPADLAVIEVEEKHFSKQRSNLYRARTRMGALREGEPPRRPHSPRPRGHSTAPHDPTAEAITQPRPAPTPRALPPSPSGKPMPRNAEELAAHVAEAERQMAADKAAIAARAAHKPKPLPFAPPRQAPMNPYENDGMPDVRAEPAQTELTPDESRASVQGSEQEQS